MSTRIPMCTLARIGACVASLVWPAAVAAQVGSTGSTGPAITFSLKGVTASGITPKGQAVWLGVSREFPEGTALMVRREAVGTDTGGTGSVGFAIDGGAPAESVWVVVDLATGAAAAAT